MSETVKLIIEIPKEDIELICKTSFVEDERTMFKQNPSDRQGTMMLHRLMDSVKNGIPLDDVKAEIEELAKHDGIYIDTDYVFEILDNIGKPSLLNQIIPKRGEGKEIKPNDMTRMFDGVTEIPKDAFKGWTSEELRSKIRTSGAEFLEEVGGEIGSSCEKFIRQMTGNEGGEERSDEHRKANRKN